MESYEVDVVSLLKNDDKYKVKEYVDKQNINLYGFYLKDASRNLYNYFLSLILFKPLSIKRNYSKKLILFLQNEYHNNIDAVIVDHFLMYPYVKYLDKRQDFKVILHEHNAEYVLWRRYSKNCNSLLLKIATLFESYRIELYEKKIINNSKCVFATVDDIKSLQRLSNRSIKYYETLHLGDDQQLMLPDLKKPNFNTLLFVGTLSWEANVDGLIWFFEMIWPELIKINKDIKINIVGKNAPEKLVKYSKLYDNIFFLGFVDDLESLYVSSDLFISPLRFGSGIKVKNINAMYRGIPLITTTVGVESIGVVDSVHALVKDSETDWVNSILQILNDEDLWNEMSLNSRKLMRENYTWDVVIDNFKKAIDE